MLYRCVGLRCYIAIGMCLKGSISLARCIACGESCRPGQGAEIRMRAVKATLTLTLLFLISFYTWDLAGLSPGYPQGWRAASC